MNQKQLCRLTSEFWAGIAMSLCDLVHKGEKCHTAPPSPTLPGEASRYWFKSHRTMNSQFGAALALLNHKYREGETFSLWHFIQQQGEHYKAVFKRWSNKLKMKQLFHSDHSAACCSARRKKLLHLSVWLICMRPRLSDLPHNKCVKTFLTHTHAKLIRQEKVVRNSISLLLVLHNYTHHCESCVSNSLSFRCPSENLSTLQIMGTVVAERRNPLFSDEYPCYSSYLSLLLHTLNKQCSFICLLSEVLTSEIHFQTKKYWTDFSVF